MVITVEEGGVPPEYNYRLFGIAVIKISYPRGPVDRSQIPAIIISTKEKP